MFMQSAHQVIQKNIQLLWWVALGLWMAATNPSKLPVWGLVVPFILLAGGVYTAARKVLKIFPATNNIAEKHQKSIAVIAASLVVMVIGLQSIGQLTFRDLITVAVLGLVGYFYLYRNVFKAS